jgi:hypothetical protein
MPNPLKVRHLLNPLPPFLPHGVAAERGQGGKLWALHIPDRVLLDKHALKVLWALHIPDRVLLDKHALKVADAYRRDDVVVEANGDDVIKAVMPFQNGVAVYVFDSNQAGEVPPHLQALVSHLAEPPDWAWMRLERWQSSL